MLIIFNNNNLTNEEKLLLCIEAAAVNSYNRYANCVLVMETKDGTFLLENNPIPYIQDYGINISSQFVIIYQPYDKNSFSVMPFLGGGEFFEYLGNNYYANEETEDDCLNTYKENIEQAEMDWAINSLSAMSRLKLSTATVSLPYIFLTLVNLTVAIIISIPPQQRRHKYFMKFKCESFRMKTDRKTSRHFPYPFTAPPVTPST